MSTRITAYTEAMEHLPAGAVLVFEDVTWEQYESLLADTADARPSTRITYDRGRLEIVTLSRGHEKHKDSIARLVYLLAEELLLSVESSGGTTWKRKRDAKGTEADTCFHSASINRVIGRDELDLDKDPPPDLVVEVDVSKQSSSKFPIYSAFGVPEIWRYIAKRNLVQMYELRGNAYLEIEVSRTFPILTPAILADFLEKSRKQGQTQALADFRRWLRRDLRSR